MTLKFEMQRLSSDYPRLKVQFTATGHGGWICDLQTETRMFGLYGIAAGSGPSKLTALLDARTSVDADVAARKRSEAELAAATENRAVAAEWDEIFSSI